jgi:hypothetical protein
MAFDAHANFPYSVVGVAPSPAISGTSLTVSAADGSRFPAVPFNATVWPTGQIPIPTNAEVVRVTARASDVLTIVRAQEGSSARSIIVGDQIAATITKKMIEDIEAAVTDVIIALTDGATPALDLSLAPMGTSGVFRLAAAGDRTIGIPSNPRAGQKFVIAHYASGGARTLALNTGTGGFRFGSDITALTQTASGKTDYIACIYNSTDNKCDIIGVSKGY